MSEPLILLPGLMCDARIFFHQIVALSLNRPVIVMPLGPGMVEDMSALVAASAPQRFAIAGQGLGGTVALDVIRRMPDRVTRSILVSTDPFGETPQAAGAREARFVAARMGRLDEAVRGEFPAAALANSSGRDEVLEVVLDMARVLGPEQYLGQAKAWQRRPDHQKTLRRWLLPTLIIAGAADTLVPPRRQEFTAELMPKGRFLKIASAGHLPTLETPELVSDAMEEFLTEPLMLR